MTSTKPAIEDISGFLGVGALEILGVFFVLDGVSGFLAFVETYSKTSAWAILVALPLLVVSYVFGIISSLSVEILLERVLPMYLTPALFRTILEAKNDVLMQKYIDAERHTLLLHGCAAAFLLLALGSWAEVPMMGRFGFVGYIGLFGGLAVAALCPFLGIRVQKKVAAYAAAATSTIGVGLPTDSTTNTTAQRAA